MSAFTTPLRVVCPKCGSLVPVPTCSYEEPRSDKARTLAAVERWNRAMAQQEHSRD